VCSKLFFIGHGQQQKELTTMRKSYKIDRMRFDERRYVTIDFLNRLDEFNDFIKEYEMSDSGKYHTPIIEFEKPLDGWGHKRYKDSVKRVLYCFVTSDVLVRCFEDDYKMEGESLEQ